MFGVGIRVGIRVGIQGNPGESGHYFWESGFCEVSLALEIKHRGSPEIRPSDPLIILITERRGKNSARRRVRRPLGVLEFYRPRSARRPNPRARPPPAPLPFLAPVQSIQK